MVTGGLLWQWIGGHLAGCGGVAVKKVNPGKDAISNLYNIYACYRCGGGGGSLGVSALYRFSLITA
jgi:hypothetical protein